MLPSNVDFDSDINPEKDPSDPVGPNSASPARFERTKMAVAYTIVI